MSIELAAQQLLDLAYHNGRALLKALLLLLQNSLPILLLLALLVQSFLLALVLQISTKRLRARKTKKICSATYLEVFHVSLAQQIVPLELVLLAAVCEMTLP